MPSTEHLDQRAPATALDRSAIPNLDLSALFAGKGGTRGWLVDRIGAACLDPGFFYVHNTCVPKTLIRRALDVTQAFFSEPDDGPVKRAVHNEKAGGNKGWEPLYGEPAYQPDTIAHVESFDFGQELTESQYHDLGIEPNIWPELPDFRAFALAYYEAVTGLGRALSEVFSELLAMDREFINRHSNETAPRTMRLLHYPAGEAPADPRHVGISAHTDFECFTIMYQTAAGLELTDTRGQWCQAPADIGTFTVIIGDMLERLSNGKLKATGHRVVNTSWTRYSMILFFALDGDHLVEPLPQFTGPDRPAAYRPVSQAGHIERELQRAHANRAAAT